MKTLDLHNTKHDDVELKVINFLNWQDPPVRIVTGKSERMQFIVEGVVKKYGYVCYHESTLNPGALIVSEKEW
jgi:hypothetical protein|tara:strand:- start:393 stop:611 length:219 start_codon:yes stop_codon:yes gene_type:complete